jgi:hypothetical protein
MLNNIDPMPPKKPVVILATPCAMHSLLPLPLVSVISSTTVRVTKLSIKPTNAMMSEYGKMIFKVSKLIGSVGK